MKQARAIAILESMAIMNSEERNETKKAGVGTMTVSRIRNGDMQIGYVKLKKVVEALGLTMAEIALPK